MAPAGGREPRRRVEYRILGSGGAFKTTLVLSCGHHLYVNPFGRYNRCKTIGCPSCAQGKPVDKFDAQAKREASMYGERVTA